jgi:hypothetical protein
MFIRTHLLVLSLCVAVTVLLTSCAETESVVSSPNTEKALVEKSTTLQELRDAADLARASKGGEDVQATLTYTAEICSGTYAGTTTNNAIFDAAQWTYYKFYGEAGDVISITVNRSTCDMDAGFSLYSGVGTTTDGLSSGGGNTELGFITLRDDDFYQVVGCGPWWDPTLSDYELTTTGWYTVAVFDVLGSSDGTYTYDLVLSGISCDSDDDGVNDNVDPFPNSDMQENIVIDGCNSGITNAYLGNGTYMMDKVLECKDNAANHDEFVSCLAGLTNTWKSAGLITGAQKGSIQSCGGQSNWP